jgi:hypothetical protein
MDLRLGPTTGTMADKATRPKSARESNAQSLKELAQSRKNIPWAADDTKNDGPMRPTQSLCEIRSAFKGHQVRPLLDMIEWEPNGATIDDLNIMVDFSFLYDAAGNDTAGLPPCSL